MPSQSSQAAHLLRLTEDLNDPDAALDLWRLATRMGDAVLRSQAASHLWRLGVLRCESASRSVRGPKRTYNEDVAFAIPGDGEHIVVALDGAGGHHNGVIAAALGFWLTHRFCRPSLSLEAVLGLNPGCWVGDADTQKVFGWFQGALQGPSTEVWLPVVTPHLVEPDPQATTPPSRLKALFVRINDAIMALSTVQTRWFSWRGTFLQGLMVWIHGDQVSVAHAGQGQLFRNRRGEITAVTEPHSFNDALQRYGVPPSPQYQTVTTRALGITPKACLPGDHLGFPLELGDQFLLCTYGLQAALGEAEILRLWRDAASGEAACDALIAAAEAANTSGNLSCACVEITALTATDSRHKQHVTQVLTAERTS